MAVSQPEEANTCIVKGIGASAVIVYDNGISGRRRGWLTRRRGVIKMFDGTGGGRSLALPSVYVSQGTGEKLAAQVGNASIRVELLKCSLDDTRITNSPTMAPTIGSSERAVMFQLDKLYNATNGANWKYGMAKGFGSGTPYCRTKCPNNVNSCSALWGLHGYLQCDGNGHLIQM